VDSDVVVACFEAFSEKLTKKTVVILDNASFHTSEKFLENIEKWEKRGLFIKYLPHYKAFENYGRLISISPSLPNKNFGYVAEKFESESVVVGYAPCFSVTDRKIIRNILNLLVQMSKYVGNTPDSRNPGPSGHFIRFSLLFCRGRGHPAKHHPDHGHPDHAVRYS